MLKVLILTNNPKVRDFEGALYYEESLFRILERARDLVHQNYRLLTHPLAGSVKPNQTPFKSIALYAEPGEALDQDSLRVIEEALGVSRLLLGDKPTPRWPENILDDFALVDFDLLQSGLASVQHL